MGKTAMRMALLGALAGTALLAGCEDEGRSWAMVAQDNYSPYRAPSVPLHRGSNTGFPRVLPQTESAMGGSGDMPAFPTQLADMARRDLEMKQDFRVPYPPSRLEAQVAEELGTGKLLRADGRGRWVQGLYSVEVGSGLTQAIAPTSAPAQPQQNPTFAPAAPPPGDRPVEVQPRLHNRGDIHSGGVFPEP